MHKLTRIVANRYDLTPDEIDELHGDTLAELASHAEHLVGRRNAVTAAKRRNPNTPDYAIEGAYDGGGVTVDTTAGKTMAADMLSAIAGGGDPDTRGFLAKVGNSALTPGPGPSTESADERRARITDRLAAAGINQED